MYIFTFIFITLLQIYLIFSQNVTSFGKRYYFKMGKDNNEFKVSNRVNFLNHNITDYDYTHKRVVTHVPKEIKIKTDYSTYYLDDEWNYDHSNNTSRDLPLFIHKFYDQLNSNPSLNQNFLRILFNTNNNSSSSVIKFDLNTLKDDETIIDADLFFYWPLKNTSKIYRESVVLRLYQFDKQYNEELNESNLIQNPDIHKLFNVIYVSKADKGWQTFKVKKPIDNWLNGDENLGLLLTISSYDTNQLIEVFNDTNIGNFATFAVVKIQNNDSISDMDNTTFTDVTTCEKTVWSINFQKLQWDNFIISPHDVAASDCSGACSLFHDDDINHAKLLHIFHKRRPCCVPVNYLPLPIMYYDEYKNVIIKNYNNVIVGECGCR